MNIVLLGSGNVATHLGLAILSTDNKIVQVWSRSDEHARDLAARLGAAYTTSLSEIDPDADLYIVSVTDDAIGDIAAELRVRRGIVVHTSGATDLQVLAGFADKVGVLYPLQTFSREKKHLDFREIPVAVEGNSQDVLGTLMALACQISGQVLEVDSKRRMALHVAAVFACNFSNHLYALAKEILDTSGLDFDLIKPLIAETAEKALRFDPREVQTGPAVRHDEGTLHKHEDFLSDRPHMLQIYQLLTRSIMKSGSSR